MSAQPGTIDRCKNCPHRGLVCPESCEVYQDLKAEYLNEIERESEREDDPIEDYSDQVDRGNR